MMNGYSDQWVKLQMNARYVKMKHTLTKCDGCNGFGSIRFGREWIKCSICEGFGMINKETGKGENLVDEKEVKKYTFITDNDQYIQVENVIDFNIGIDHNKDYSYINLYGHNKECLGWFDLKKMKGMIIE